PLPRDWGGAHEVAAEATQRHLAPAPPVRRKRPGVDGTAVINQALGGGLDLNARLTQLERGYAESKAQLHLEPANLRRVVDTALRISHQPALVEIGDPDADAVFE